jgi:hypothetical protein
MLLSLEESSTKNRTDRWARVEWWLRVSGDLVGLPFRVSRFAIGRFRSAKSPPRIGAWVLVVVLSPCSLRMGADHTAVIKVV